MISFTKLTKVTASLIQGSIFFLPTIYKLVVCATVWSKSEVMLPISEKLNTAQLASYGAMREQSPNFPRYYQKTGAINVKLEIRADFAGSNRKQCSTVIQCNQCVQPLDIFNYRILLNSIRGHKYFMTSLDGENIGRS